MFKKLSIILASLFIGCSSTNISVDKKIKETNIENSLIQKYEITKNSLTSLNNYYYFYKVENKGITIYKMDKNYNLVDKKIIPIIIDTQKITSNNKNLYLIGYDENKQKPIILIIDSDLNIKEKKYIGDKFDVPKDIVTNSNKINVLLLTYKNGADFKICNLKNCKTFSKPNNQLPKFIKKFNDGYLVIGSYQDNKEDLYIAFIKNNKIVWEKRYDFGYSDIPQKVIIKNDKIFINVNSTDYMGANKYLTIILDKNGKLIKKEQNLEFQQLPTKLRT
ncbi:hypothetical protein FE773_08080 [Caminibacter mediatlanticus TB-2]|uniref:Lipoprotein n=1 Tax=Caminibacter mediatlanticus TB-2 TaxID=391592 RepID=A0ABX5VAW7_9BACT|nr:hypothetical protein [Caminibacter mediatlanticus]QCT95149.1 hypothetical protein FE773_08080 [Caminibacter mediatlanticus TB-2]